MLQNLRERAQRSWSVVAVRQPWVGSIGLAAAVGIAYFLAARLSLLLLAKPDRVAVFWPAAGVAAGTLIALGPCGTVAGGGGRNGGDHRGQPPGGRPDRAGIDRLCPVQRRGSAPHRRADRTLLRSAISPLTGCATCWACWPRRSSGLPFPGSAGPSGSGTSSPLRRRSSPSGTIGLRPTPSASSRLLRC